jgi:carboxylesterase
MSQQPYGVLMLHGFPSNPGYFDPVNLRIEALKLPVRIPRLRGLGAESPEALRGVTWHDWLADAESAFVDLQAETGKVIVIGYSMGGALALMLASKYGGDLDSVILVAAEVQLTSPLAPGKPFNFLAPLVSRLLKKWDFTPDETDHYRKNYVWAPMGAVVSVLDLSKEVRTHLAEVKSPALIIQSHRDAVVAPESMDIIYNGISTPPELKRKVWLEKTGHDMFHDCEGDVVIDTMINYVHERVGMAQ